MTALSKNDLIAHLTDTFKDELSEVEVQEHFRMHSLKVMGVLKDGVTETPDLRQRMEQELDNNTLPQIVVELVLLGK